MQVTASVTAKVVEGRSASEVKGLIVRVRTKGRG